MVKAYAIATVHRKAKDGKFQVVPASTATKVSVFDAEDGEFADLEKLGGVRKATKDEIALARSQAAEVGNAAFESDVAGDDDTAAAEKVSKKAPDSGAPGDPNSKPSKAPKSEKPAKEDESKGGASKDDDLGI